MKEFLRSIRDGIVSLRLTVALLILGIVLVFAATLDQTNLGIWGIQQKWFRSFVVMQEVRGAILPIFPGGYLIGGLLLINLTAAHIYRFTFSWKKSGIFLTHIGFILLLLGELLSGLWQEDFSMRLNVGETKSYAESFRFNELAILDTTNPEYDDVVAIPEKLLERHASIQHPKLPFRVTTKAFYPNSSLQMKPENGPPSLATAGLGLRVTAAPQPVSYKQNEGNMPSAYVEIAGTDATIGTYLVSTGLVASQEFQYAGRTWKMSLRSKRIYRPFEIKLEKFTHDKYVGTEIPKNFASHVRLSTPGAADQREVVISMNDPLRHDGLTFYQASFENNDRTSILQVVRNPSWQLPYIACSLMGTGLLIQFGVHLLHFIGKRRSLVPASA